MAYELRGQFLEACDCYVMCPCWFEEEPDESECTGIVGWYIEAGEIDGVDVSGLSVVSVSHHGGHRRGGRARVALFVDEQTDDEQAEALVDAFTGRLGGPLGELSELTDEVTEVERTSIAFASDGKETKLRVGRRVSATMRPLVGATDRVTTLADSALARLLGTPAEVGKSSRYRLSLGHDNLDLDVRERSANRGRFAYRSGRRRTSSRT